MNTIKSSPVLRRIAVVLATSVVVVSLSTCRHPEKHGNAHLDDFLGLHKIQLPDEIYQQIAATLNARGRDYDGNYVPAGIDKIGNPVKLEGDLKPDDPGQILTVKTNDPAFRDRSLARLMINWTPYFDKDFRHVAGPNGADFADPVTYYRDYQRWRQTPDRKPEDEPSPRVYLFVPTHFLVSGGNVRTFGDIINLMLKVDEMGDREARLDAMHNLISWLKGDPVREIGPFPVGLLTNDHFTGIGMFFAAGMMFPPITTDDELPMPSLTIAIKDALSKLIGIKTEFPFPGLFDAKFTVKAAFAYQEFVDSGTLGVLYESLAYTDDPIILANEGLQPDPSSHENIKKVDGSNTRDAIFRGIALSSTMSDRRDDLGRPTVNRHVQHPPSGTPLEEASFFLHVSMVHALDGWGVASWSSSHRMMISMERNYLGKHDVGGDATSDEGHPPPDVGIREQWNANYQPDNARFCRDSAELPPSFMPHMEIYDSHIYLPHGDLARTIDRYNQITNADPNELVTPAQWAAVGYVTATTDTVVSPPNDTPRLLTVSECRSKGLNCDQIFKSAFSAPYCGPYSRLRTSMSPEHCTSKDADGTPAMSDPIVQVFHEALSESVVDTIDCRNTIDTVMIDCERCKYVDNTPVPYLANGKPAVIGEQLAFLWIHLWPYGSMYTIHGPSEHLPRYWSFDNQNGGRYAGLMSVRNSQLTGNCPDPDTDCVNNYPDETKNDAAWFVNDVHGYFGAPVDRNLIRRAGRGDPMYLLRHYTKAFLNDGCNFPDPSFPKKADDCSCGK